MTRACSLQAVYLAVSLPGLGLLVWLGTSIALLQGGLPEMEALRAMQARSVMLAMVLSLPAALVIRSLPGSPWRRASVAALLLALAAAGFILAGLRGQLADPGWVAIGAALMCIGAIATTLAIGMGVSTRSAGPWRSQLVAPGLLAHALLAGSAVLFALIAMGWPERGLLASPAASMALLVVVAGAIKQLYWHENGGLRAAGGQLGPSSALQMRLAVILALVVLPLLLAGVVAAWPGAAARWCWWLIAASVVAGVYLDQRLLQFEADANAAPPARPTS